MTTGRTPSGAFDDDGDVGIFDDRPSAVTDAERDPAVAAFVAALRAEAEGPAPEPRGALAELLATGGTPVEAARSASVVPLSGRSRGRKALRTGAQVALGLGLAVASVGAAAAVDGVPAVLKDPARTVVDAVADVLTGGSGPEDLPGLDGPTTGEGSGTTAPDVDPTVTGTDSGSDAGRSASGGSLAPEASETAEDAVEKEPGVPAEPGRGVGRPTDAPDDRRPDRAPATPATPDPTDKPAEPGKAAPAGPATPERPVPSLRPTLPPPGDLIGGPSDEKRPERP